MSQCLNKAKPGTNQYIQVTITRLLFLMLMTSIKTFGCSTTHRHSETILNLMTPDDNVANKTETEVNPEQRQGVAVTRILQT